NGARVRRLLRAVLGIAPYLREIRQIREAPKSGVVHEAVQPPVQKVGIECVAKLAIRVIDRRLWAVGAGLAGSLVLYTRLDKPEAIKPPPQAVEGGWRRHAAVWELAVMKV